MSAERFLIPNSRLKGDQARIADLFAEFWDKITNGRGGPDVTIEDYEQWELGVQKLVEAKDCFVRSTLPDAR